MYCFYILIVLISVLILSIVAKISYNIGKSRGRLESWKNFIEARRQACKLINKNKGNYFLWT